MILSELLDELGFCGILLHRERIGAGDLIIKVQ